MRHYKETLIFLCVLFISWKASAQSEYELYIEAGAITNIVTQHGSEYKFQPYEPRPGFYLGASYPLPLSINAFVIGGFFEYTRLKDFAEDVFADQDGNSIGSSKHRLRQMDFAISGLYRVSLGNFHFSSGAKFNLLAYGSSKSVYPHLKLTASTNHLNWFDIRIPVRVELSADNVSFLIQYERGLLDRLKGKGGVSEFNNVLKLGMNIGF